MGLYILANLPPGSVYAGVMVCLAYLALGTLSFLNLLEVLNMIIAEVQEIALYPRYYGKFWYNLWEAKSDSELALRRIRNKPNTLFPSHDASLMAMSSDMNLGTNHCSL
jgi:hypothetical protein